MLSFTSEIILIQLLILYFLRFSDPLGKICMSDNIILNRSWGFNSCEIRRTSLTRQSLLLAIIDVQFYPVKRITGVFHCEFQARGWSNSVTSPSKFPIVRNAGQQCSHLMPDLLVTHEPLSTAEWCKCVLRLQHFP